jgi:hypothetical protein
MFSVSPEMKPKFDSLSQNLKDAIVEKDVPINSLQDIIKVLEDISNDPKFQ